MSDLIRCYLCGSFEHTKREGRVRDNVDLAILECRNCGLVFLSNTSHIHDGLYENSLMHDEIYDIWYILKDISEDSKRRIEYLKNHLINKD